MWLLEYIYFQSLQWMRRQGRKSQDAIDTAIMPLGLSLVLYSLGIIGLIGLVGEFNPTLAVAEHWPRISEHGKYLKPTHGLGILLSVAILVFVYAGFHRKARRKKIENWFSETASDNEIQNGHWSVWAFVGCSFAFTASFFFSIFWMMGLIVAALAIGNFVVYRRHYQGR